jgi:hypothetical protein
VEGSKNGPGKEDPTAVSRGEKRDPEPAANTSKDLPNPDQTTESSSPETSEDHANPEATTPEQEARRESEERIRELLKAYQQTLDTVEDLPAVVWVPWDRKGPGSYFKVPYLRLFLKYFVEYHIDRSLNTLNRRFYATAGSTVVSRGYSRTPDTAPAPSRTHCIATYSKPQKRIRFRYATFATLGKALQHMNYHS